MKYLILLIFISSFSVFSKTTELHGVSYETYQSDGFTYLVKKDPADPPKRKYRYLSMLEINSKISMGLGFHIGWSYFSDEAFKVTKNGSNGQFGEIYDGSSTVVNNNNLFLTPTLELRFADKLKIGGGFDFHMNRGHDSNGTIVFSKNDEGRYVVTEITGERRSFVSSEADDLGSFFTQNYHAYIDYDIIVIPDPKRDILVSLGAFTRKMTTDHGAGIHPLGDEFSTTFRDYGVRFGLGLIEGGEVLPVRISGQFGFKGSKELKIGVMF